MIQTKVLPGQRLAAAHGAKRDHQPQRQCKQQCQGKELTIEQERAGQAHKNHRHKNTPFLFRIHIPLPSQPVKVPSAREPFTHRQQKASLTEGGCIASR